MLRVGLTGGIGSGKSTVAGLLRDLGAEVVDADVVAREVVEPGMPVLTAIAARFGPRVLRPDGSLDRAALAALVFPDPDALAALDAITGPVIAGRVAQLRADADPARVSVYDMPLLVERGLGALEHLVVVVGATEKTRVRRLVEERGLPEADVRARVARQATDADRRAAADVWLDNEGSVQDLQAVVTALWQDRLVPFNEQLLAGTPSRPPTSGAVVAADPTWPEQAARLSARITAALGDRALRVDHVGSTAVPGLLAKDVIDLQIGVRRLVDADDPGFVRDLTAAGFVRVPDFTWDRPHPPDLDPERWRKRFYSSVDPGRVADVHVREVGSPGWLFALRFRDWLRADPSVRDGYADLERRLPADSDSTAADVEAEERWFDEAYPLMVSWGERTGWHPSA